MPGIESFGRDKPASDSSSKKIPISPDELADLLFSQVGHDMIAGLDIHTDRFADCPTFQPNNFERRKFVYLVAGVAIALTNVAQKQDAILEVIAAFRHRVRLMMQQYWGVPEKESDSEIEEAASDYTKLVFTKPDDERGPSFDFAQAWLRRVGIEETNPIALFKISHTWKLHHSHMLNRLSSMQVVGREAIRVATHDEDRQSRKVHLKNVKHSPSVREWLSKHSVSDPTLVTDLSFPRRTGPQPKLARKIVQKDLPEEKLKDFFKLARTLIDKRVNTPQELARHIPETRRAYAQALWDIMGAINRELRGEHDWNEIFSAVTRSAGTEHSSQPEAD